MQPINLTVRQLNTYVRSLLEGDSNLSALTLEGELSNFKNHYSSGHWYFVLKDADASVRGVMFRGNALRVNFEPKDGMRVICTGYVSLYEKDGQYQFYAETMRPFGEGDIAAEFERIKRKLEAEGLFDPIRKRPLPIFPEKIGVITSETGAALQDILNILGRRYRLTDIVLFPALVQGSAAPESMISALDKAYKREEIDVIIIGRGGGSAEDLSCFNDETLARKIALSPVPVISAVGHEVDFTICDFVSDLRAPTPSAAAELAVPSGDELLMRIQLLSDRNIGAVKKILDGFNFRLDNYISRRCFSHPELLFSPYEIRLDTLIDKLKTAYVLKTKSDAAALDKLYANLKALSPVKVMERGFSAVYHGGELIKSAEDINIDDEIKICFWRGNANCIVTRTEQEGK